MQRRKSIGGYFDNFAAKKTLYKDTKTYKMKTKTIALCASACIALGTASCGSSESAYKKAYEKAKAGQQANAGYADEDETPLVTPVVEKPYTQATTVDNIDNASVRPESVTLIDGAGLKAYSVVVGSFSIQSNAQGLQSKLRTAGYDAQIVKNTERNLFRVVASTFDDKGSAVRSREQLRASYQDAWLLYSK